MEKRLNIISVDSLMTSHQASRASSSPRLRKQEAQARFERLWLVDPKQFDPSRNCLERERIHRTWRLLEQFCGPLKEKRICDLGCGWGMLSKKMAHEGALVDAVDIASNALKHVKNNAEINAIQDYVPRTSLKDEAYDIVICTELIAYLPKDEYRLLFSEMNRIVKPNGFVLCSTAIDIYSEDALQRFGTLAVTEFTIEKWVYSYHALYLRIKSFFEAPERFVRAWRDPDYRRNEIKGWWARANSKAPLVFLWFPFKYAFFPITKVLKENKRCLLFLEKICRFFNDISGISHAIFIGKRRPLVFGTEKEKPNERPKRKEVWE